MRNITKSKLISTIILGLIDKIVLLIRRKFINKSVDKRHLLWYTYIIRKGRCEMTKNIHLEEDFDPNKFVQSLNMEETLRKLDEVQRKHGVTSPNKISDEDVREWQGWI
jgi:hypothetical protein